MGPLLNPLYWLLAAMTCALAVGGGALAAIAVAAVTRRILARGKHSSPSIQTAVPLLVGAAFAVVMTSVVCTWSLRGPATPKSRPAPVDLIGTWTLTEQSRELLEDQIPVPDDPPRFEFHADGSFSAVNIPQHDFDTGSVLLGASGGTWNTDRDHNGDWAIELHFPVGPAGELGGVTERTLLGRVPPYQIVIWENYDAGLGYIFRRDGDVFPE